MENDTLKEMQRIAPHVMKCNFDGVTKLFDCGCPIPTEQNMTYCEAVSEIITYIAIKLREKGIRDHAGGNTQFAEPPYYLKNYQPGESYSCVNTSYNYALAHLTLNCSVDALMYEGLRNELNKKLSQYNLLIPHYVNGIGNCFVGSSEWLGKNPSFDNIFKYHEDANADHNIVLGNWFVDFIPEKLSKTDIEGDRSGRIDHFLSMATIVADSNNIRLIEYGTSENSYRDKIQYRLGALFGAKLVIGEITPDDISDWIRKNASGARRLQYKE